MTWSSLGSISNLSGMCSKRTKKLSLGLYHTQIRADEHGFVAMLGPDLISRGLGMVDTASDWLIKNLGMVM